ncbi:FIST signal transduction protein [Thiomicrorhabdus aquaedulcis]|uniref:FIST signal transduction protein n=1 Tax=Thiomicrorhabdus aquaedulcis TaxID=2211106 RepID=UPI000FDC78AC|nr:FIST N-terminal domain-containing protein [Thiomicrorhabdus aquaedulcis]
MQLKLVQYLEGAWSENLAELASMNSQDTFGLVFADAQLSHMPNVLAELYAAFPNVHFVGGSTAGEIFGAEVNDASVAVCLVRLEKSAFKVSIAQVDDFENAYAIGEHLGQTLAQPHPAGALKGIFVLADGLHVNGTHLVNGLMQAAPNTLITGGLMGDGPRFENTFVLAQGNWASKQVVAIGFYGQSIQLSHGSKGGWDVFGPERQVTRAVDNIVYEFDGTPALALYKTYLGDLAEGLPGSALLFPLAIISADGERLVRTIVQIDVEQQALIFAGDVPEGATVQLMKANFDRLIDGAYSAAELVNWQNLPQQPTLSIAISCVGRRLILKGRVEEEVEATLDALPANTQQIGFYSYGEISPMANGVCSLHNQTMTLTTLREE